jgi:lysophospholipase L1-like esterase
MISRTKKALGLGIVSVVALIGICEVGARIAERFNPAMKLDFFGTYSERTRTFVAEPTDPNYMITNPPKIVTFIDQTFALKKAPGTFRIVALGESTLNFLHKELMEAEAVLNKVDQKNYEKIQIINAGGKSYGTQRLTIVAKELLTYEPDLLMIYIGQNEHNDLAQLTLYKPERAQFMQTLYRSAFLRLVAKSIRPEKLAELEVDSREELLSRPPNDDGWTHRYSVEEVAERMRRYRHNLEIIIEMYQAKNIKILISTVPSNLVQPHYPEEVYENQYFKVTELIKEKKYDEAHQLAREILKNTPNRHQSSDSENEIIRDLAQRYNLPLVDVEKEVIAAEPHHIPGETLFWDHCHLNKAGNQILINTFMPPLVAAVKNESL